MSCSPLRAPAALADEESMARDGRRLSPGAARTEGRPRRSGQADAALAEMAEGSPIFLDYSFGDDPLAPSAPNAPLEEGEAEADLFLPEDSHPELVNGPALLPAWPVQARSGRTLVGLPETITSQPEVPELPRRRDRLDPDVVRAWAAAVTPLTGVSRTEPLVTVAMVATPDISAGTTSAAGLARDVLSLASAFAGQQNHQHAPTPPTPQPLE